MNSRPYTVHIYEEEEAEFISKWTLDYPNIETGGDFFGLWLSETEVVIQAVLGPGQNCRRTTTSFFQNETYLSKVGGLLTGDEGLCNIGSWHSHHSMNLAEPSRGDEDTVWKHLPTQGRFLLLIANIKVGREGPKVQMSFCLFQSTDKGKKRTNMNCSVLKGRSPIRANQALSREMDKGAELLSKKTPYPEPSVQPVVQSGIMEVDNELSLKRMKRHGPDMLVPHGNGNYPQRTLHGGRFKDQRLHHQDRKCDGVGTLRYTCFDYSEHRRPRKANHAESHGYWLSPGMLRDGLQVLVLRHFDHRAGGCQDCCDASLRRRRDGKLQAVVGHQNEPGCCIIL